MLYVSLVNKNELLLLHADASGAAVYVFMLLMMKKKVNKEVREGCVAAKIKLKEIQLNVKAVSPPFSFTWKVS
jgi:hypothetical protein